MKRKCKEICKVDKKIRSINYKLVIGLSIGQDLHDLTMLAHHENTCYQYQCIYIVFASIYRNNRVVDFNGELLQVNRIIH